MRKLLTVLVLVVGAAAALYAQEPQRFERGIEIIRGRLTLPTTIVFEGATGDAHETTLTVVDPTADRTVTLQNLTGTVLVDTGAITTSSATTGVGYKTGAGGAVTQATSASTGVTLSKPAGQITTVALTTAAAAEEEFTVTNTLVAATDVIVVSTTYAGAGTPAVSIKGVAAGSFVVTITNLHAANALNAAVVINFAVVKAVGS